MHITLKKFLSLTILLFCFMLVAKPGQSQRRDSREENKVRFGRLSIEQGLSHSSVNCILQDTRGFMWFGTNDGLNKYNGYDFSIYRYNPDDPNTLSSSNIVTICEDRFGDIWIGTFENGLNRYDPVDDRFTRYRSNLDDPTALQSDVILCLYEDSAGELWIGTWGGGLNKYNREDDSFTCYLEKFPTFHPDLFDRINSLKEQNRQAASLLCAGNQCDTLQILNVSEPTTYLIVCTGEADQDKLADFGQITAQETIWSMQLAKSKNAGGTQKNRIQIDTITLAPGRYTLRYHTDDSHSYGHWNDNPPAHPELWGIQLFEISDREEEFFSNQSDYCENSISDNNVVSLFEDTARDLWIGTRDGLNKFDRKNEFFTRYPAIPQNPERLSHPHIRSIYQDSSGAMWFGTGGGGLNKLVADSTFDRYLIDPADLNSPTLNDIVSICEYPEGTLWIGTDGGGAFEFDLSSRQFTQHLTDPNAPYSLSNNYIRAFFKDRSGILWIGTWGGGINTYNRREKKFHLYQSDPNNPNSLSQDRVLAVYEDSRNHLWIGTDGGGLDRYDQSSGVFSHFKNKNQDPASLSNNFVTSVYEDKTGTLWIGTYGGGLNTYDGKRFRTYRHNPADPGSLSYDQVKPVIEYAGMLWIGTLGGGVNAFDGDRFISYRYNSNDPFSLSNNTIYCMCADSHGTLWLGTNGGGVNRYDRESGNGRFIRYRHDNANTSSLSSDNVFSIYEDSAGELWIGTVYGLNKFDHSAEGFFHYFQNDGLPSNTIYSILEDDDGYLWLGTNNGLSKFDPKREIFQNFDVQDGLQGNVFSLGACFKGKNGRLFFGGTNGLNAFNPDEIFFNTHVPPVVITDFRLFNQSVPIGADSPLKHNISESDEISLSYRENVFSFDFSALDYSSPDKNQYAYILEGFDRQWIHTDARRRFAAYTNLSGGEYIFRVIGSNNDGVWNEKGATIKIIISPPFWKTWWFIALSVLLVSGLLYFLYRRRLTNVRLKTELQAAHKAQMSIMPQKDPKVTGFDISGICIPAFEVGGDFFDYFWMDEAKSKFGIAIGDVSGKAMESAMTAVMASGMINIEVRENESVDAIMNRVNRLIYNKTERKTFTALFLAALEVNKRELSFTNAGLTKPLLKSQTSVSFLEGSGPKVPLGMTRNTKYLQSRIRLKSGDVLIISTDGIPEAQNHGRDFYGYDTLMRRVQNIDTDTRTAAAIISEILLDVQRFAGKRPQYDDLAVVVIKVL